MSTNRKTETISFRLDSKTIELLNKTTRRLKTSPSAFISSMIAERLKLEPLIENISGISLSRELFSEILAQANITGLEILASEMAKKNLPYVFELLELEPNRSSILWYLKEILQECGWFKIQESQGSEESLELTLFHDCGMKWSLFLKSYVTSMYEAVHLERPQVTTMNERLVKIRLCRDRSIFLQDTAGRVLLQRTILQVKPVPNRRRLRFPG